MITDSIIQDHIQKSVDVVAKMFDISIAYVTDMPIAIPIPATKVAAELGPKFSLSGPTFYTINRLILKDFPGLTVSKAGLIKSASASKQDIDANLYNVLEKVKEGFTAGAIRLEEVKAGKKISNTQLCDEAGAAIGLKGHEFYQTLRFLINDYPGITVGRGKAGGIKAI